MKKIFRRLLSVPLCVVMLFCLLPTSALTTEVSAATATELYLDTNATLWGQWDNEGGYASYAAYFYKTGGETWAEMRKVGDHLYHVKVPSGGWTNVIFVRKDPVYESTNWNNKWGQTSDLTMPATSKTFKVTGSTGSGTSKKYTGSWSTVTAPTGFAASTTLYFAPNYDWTKDDAKMVAYLYGPTVQERFIEMTKNDDLTYQVTTPSAGYTTVIFCRISPLCTEYSLVYDSHGNWNWTRDSIASDFSSGKNCMVITSGSDTSVYNNAYWNADSGGSHMWTKAKSEYIVRPASRTVYFDNTVYNWYNAYAFFKCDYTSGTHAPVISGAKGVTMTKVNPYLYKVVVPAACSASGTVVVKGDGGYNGNAGQNPVSSDPARSISGKSQFLDADSTNGGVWLDLTVGASLATGTGFSGELDLTFFNAEGITNTTFTLSGTGVPAAYTTANSFTNGQNVVIDLDTTDDYGDPLPFGSTITLTVSGVKDGSTVTKTYTYLKGRKFYAEKPDGWDTVFATELNTSGNHFYKNVKYPGIEMTYNSRTGLYEFVVTNDEEGVDYVTGASARLYMIGKSTVTGNGTGNAPNIAIVNGATKLVYTGNTYSYKLKKVGDTYYWNIFPPLSISADAVVTLSGDGMTDNKFHYDGNSHSVTYVVTFLGKTLVEGTDFVFEGHNQATDIGSYVVKIKGKGDYTDSVSAVWEIYDPITVTVDGVAKQYNYGYSLVVKADPEKNGQQFAYWQDSDGNKLSYSAEYGFTVKESVSLTPVYQDSAPDKESVLRIKASQSTYNRKNAILYTFTHSVPEDYEIVEVGLRYSTNKLAGADTTINDYSTVNLVTDGPAYGVANVESVVKNKQEKVKEFVAKYQKHDGTVQFYYALGEYTTAYTYAVGYVKVRLNDAEQILYTDLLATTYNGASSGTRGVNNVKQAVSR